jgi:hypothetical protein
MAIKKYTISEAVDYLKSQGYKIEKSKLYEDKHIIGFSTSKGSAVFEEKALDKYAKKFLFLLSGSDVASPEEKLKWETKIAEQKFNDMAFEAKVKQGMYVLKSEVEQMLAARAAFLKDNLGSGFIHSRAAKIAELLKGNPDNIPELIEFYLKHIEEVFDYYSKPMKFTVPMSAVEEFLENKSEVDSNIET